MKKRITPAALCLLLLPLYSTTNAQVNATVNNTPAEATVPVKDSTAKPTAETPAKKDTIMIIAVGDIQLGTMFPNKTFLPSATDGPKFLSEVEPVLRGGDVTFCNFEGTFADATTQVRGGIGQHSYRFGMPPSYVNYLKDAHFNLIGTANNHTNDYETGGRRLTATVLDSAGVHWAGHENRPFCVFEENGVRYGFCAVAPHTGVLNIEPAEDIEKIVRDLKEKEKCDIVIVSMHIGAEGTSAQHITRKTEIFLGANRGNPHQFAHRLIDAGADVILGHGPHVLRAIEVYKGKFIAYSMGNFACYSSIGLKGPLGLSAVYRLKYHVPTGNFIEGELVSTYQQKPHTPGPHIDSTEQKGYNTIMNLTKTDFPESTIQFGKDGHIK